MIFTIQRDAFQSALRIALQFVPKTSNLVSHREVRIECSTENTYLSAVDSNGALLRIRLEVSGVSYIQGHDSVSVSPGMIMKFISVGPNRPIEISTTGTSKFIGDTRYFTGILLKDNRGQKLNVSGVDSDLVVSANWSFPTPKWGVILAPSVVVEALPKIWRLSDTDPDKLCNLFFHTVSGQQVGLYAGTSHQFGRLTSPGASLAGESPDIDLWELPGSYVTPIIEIAKSYAKSIVVSYLTGNMLVALEDNSVIMMFPKSNATHSANVPPLFDTEDVFAYGNASELADAITMASAIGGAKDLESEIRLQFNKHSMILQGQNHLGGDNTYATCEIVLAGSDAPFQTTIWSVSMLKTIGSMSFGCDGEFEISKAEIFGGESFRLKVGFSFGSAKIDVIAMPMKKIA